MSTSNKTMRNARNDAPPDPLAAPAAAATAALQPGNPETESVQRLIAGNLDSADGLDLAADNVRERSLEELCRHTASIRRRHAVELQRGIAERGAVTHKTGSWLAGLRRLFTRIAGKLRRRPTPLMLHACEREEDHLRDEYEQAVAVAHSASLRQMILRQQAHVTHTQRVLHDLRMAAEAKEESA